MARPLIYQETEKNKNENEQALLQLKEGKNPLHSGPTESAKHLLTHAAIIECVELLLRREKFIDTAHAAYCRCKNILGATSGYIALIDQSGKNFDVLHLDTGGLTCTVNSDLPMPIRGLRKEALQKEHAICCNNFKMSKWLKFLPKGHIHLENVLLAPLVIEQIPVGLFGFANKPEFFDQDDTQIATSFAKLASLALANSKAWNIMKETWYT